MALITVSFLSAERITENPHGGSHRGWL